MIGDEDDFENYGLSILVSFRYDVLVCIWSLYGRKVTLTAENCQLQVRCAKVHVALVMCMYV
jgi:hypothetical protein